jgi:hypothetical protein
MCTINGDITAFCPIPSPTSYTFLPPCSTVIFRICSLVTLW